MKIHGLGWHIGYEDTADNIVCSQGPKNQFVNIDRLFYMICQIPIKSQTSEGQ